MYEEFNQQSDLGENYEQKIIAAAIKSREAWEKITSLLSDGDLTERGEIIWKGICEYYAADADCQSVPRQELIDGLSLKIKREGHRVLLVRIIDEACDLDVSAGNVARYILGVKRENAAFALAAQLANAGEISPENAELGRTLDRFLDLLGDDGEKQEDRVESTEGLTLKEVYDLSYGEEGEGFTIWPPSLGARLGTVTRGHHIVVFARPEMGKTMTTLNLVAGLATTGNRILYVCNEEPVGDLYFRMACRLLNRSRNEILGDLEGAHKAAKERGLENVIFRKLHPGTIREISMLCSKLKPDVLVVDQIRNLQTKEDSRVNSLDTLAQGVRALASKHNLLAISVTQAGESAEGKAALGMTDVDFSNTGIPGACDVMIGVGATANDVTYGRRMISLPKNKTGGGDHAVFSVQCNTQTGVIKDITG